jgi:undecaprenyl-diphosphatase
MSILEAIILGIIQGLSEFIPISSTAHLTFAGKYMGLIDADNPQIWTAFIAVIQLGTLVAVLYYFYKEILDISNSFIKENLVERKSFSNQSLNSKMGWYVIFASIPIVTVGLLLKKVIESNLTKDLTVISFSLIGLAIILYIAEKISKFERDMSKVTLKDSIVIGLAQCIALIPGSSRSGTTITAGLFLGLTRETAAKFSFLVGIPAIFGAGVYEFYSEFKYLTGDMLLPVIVATIFSAISGYFAIDFLIKYLKKNNTNIFIIYRIVAGVAILAIINF